MSRIARRTLSGLCLLLVLCMPLQAQRETGPVDTLSSFLSAFWSRISDPLGFSKDADKTDGRGAVDPDGATASSDGRGACDPDGAAGCGS